jgi:hypothetical protein
MILLDKPYVSDFLKQTIAEQQLPVIRTEQLQQFELDEHVRLWEPAEAIESFKNGRTPLLYTNSENAISWIVENLGFTGLPEQIKLLKDKVAFRELSQELFPDFQFRTAGLHELDAIAPESLRLPCVVKPAVGFFSMGVHKVASPTEWRSVVRAIWAEMAAVQALYPVEVLDTTQFIIEDCLDGEELAIDLYYNGAGQPVILNIFLHLFDSDMDVSDRVYVTSGAIIRRYRERLNAVLADVGRLANLRHFPVHAEVRIDGRGRIRPIEVNPMRFGGWCATDIAYHAYGLNPYVCYFRQLEPDWDRILAAQGDRVYAVVVLDKPRDVPAERIAAFDYDRLLAQFERPLELRRIDYREYPVFGFLIVETRADNMAELESILRSDLKEFIQMVGFAQ